MQKVELSKGHEQFEDLIENASVGIHLVDETGTILYANKEELRMLRYSANEYIGHKISEFHADQPVIDSIISKLKNHEQLNNHEARLVCKDGSIREVLINSNVYWKEDKFIHTRCFTRDITSRRKTEKLLQFLNKASEELTATLDTQEALDGIAKFIVPEYADWFTIDVIRNGKVELVKMAHADPKKISWAKKFREKNPVDLGDEKFGSTGYVVRTKEAVLLPDIPDEMLVASAQDNEHLEILRNLALRSAMVIPMLIKGKVLGVVCFISCTPNKYDESDLSFARDFSNRLALTLENSRMYEEAKDDIKRRIEIDRAKDEFLSMASHELKTPVTSLKAFTQLLQMTFEEEKNDKAVDMLSKMDKQIDKLNHLIVDLLNATKVDKGELTYDFEDFDFNKLVEEIVEVMQRTTQTHIINKQLANSEIIKGDRNRVGQVITNFVSNAIKFSPNAAEIIVQTINEKDNVKLCVKDYGIGIPSDEQSKIFTRFYRVRGKNKYSTFPGMGLGLYISSEIIKKHKGTVGLECVEDKGCTFSFTLPKV
ncbi:MAG TPA: PAS domain-containing sensor histidine kinase [Chitinophagaceae bacterium]|nr:PAS domain-containing sensor histidine kinase [Chitinophagaceae bacterium]